MSIRLRADNLKHAVPYVTPRKMRDFTILDLGRGRRVYYYKGNIFSPLGLQPGQDFLVEKAVKRFLKKNRAKIRQDRLDPSYKNLVELFDSQVPLE